MGYQDPTFDKAEYKRRRDAGMRGQPGYYLSGRGATYFKSAEVGNKPVSIKATLKRTKRWRKQHQRLAALING